MDKNNLVHLFDAELEYDDSMSPVVESENREGELIGNGKGSVRGDKVNGKICWSFYSENCAYLLVKKDKEVPEGQHLCYTNPGGYITTDDGAEIAFNAKGFGFRGANPEKPHMWVLTSGLQFQSEDERYKWLNNKLGIWEGEFDETKGRASYRAYVQNREV